MSQRAVSELRQIPFSHLIGAPMKSAIEAQALAAQSTIEFIQEVGFKKDSGNETVYDDPDRDANTGEVRSVTFTYEKKNEDGEDHKFEMTVPFLTIVPIPYLRIDEMTIDFKAKLTDSIVRNTSNKVDNEAGGGLNFSPLWSPWRADFRASTTRKRDSSSQRDNKREYTMDIHVRAVQDSMPDGLAKVLEILEDAIKDAKKESSD